MDLPYKEIWAGAGAICAYLAGLWTAHIKWKYDKQKMLIEYRQGLIKAWREEFAKADPEALGDTAAYSSLRPHMSPEVIQQLEQPRAYIVPGGRGEHPRLHRVLDEVARIEKTWGLV